MASSSRKSPEENEPRVLESAATGRHESSEPEASISCIIPERGESMEEEHTTPAMKKRKLEKYPGFTLEKQEYLKTYDSLETKVGKILNTMYKKLTKSLPQDNTPYEIKYLMERLHTLKEKTSLEPIYIGLIGRTGAGKSSLLNALINQQFFLPVSGNETCTSCVVQVSSCRGENYEAKIHLLSLQEWKEELKNLVQLVKRPEEQEQKEEEEETTVGEAIQKIRALYGRNAETRSYEDLLKAKLLVDLPRSKYRLLKAAKAEELSNQLDPYIRCHNNQEEEEPAQDEERANTQIWPLIKYVEVMIPKSDIPEGVVFVDIPGTGDYNSKRDEMWKESINKCSVIWIISEIKRIVGEKEHEVLLTETINAYQCGMCQDITLVVTQTDNLVVKEYLRERKRKHPSIETKHDAILERNENVKQTKSKEMKTKLQTILTTYSEILQNLIPVYTVSAQEYWEKNYLTEEETEIPKLRQDVKNLYLKRRKKLLREYVAEALGIVLLAKNFSSTQDMDHYQQSDLEAFVDEEIKDLEKNIEKCFAQLEQPLTEGVKHAKSSWQGPFFSLLTLTNSNRGFHKTLKAVCQKNGVYASPTFARIDLNSDFAQPIYKKINHIFAQTFRTRRNTRAILQAHFDTFKGSVEAKIHEVGKKSPVDTDTCKLDFLINETNIILRKRKREIWKKRMDVYQSLSLSIQSDLCPYYEEAAKIHGKDSCQKMKNLLKESIERKTKDGMFERAKEKMKAQFQKLKNDIVTNLQKDISTMLKLAFSHQEELTKRLPDLQDEYEEIDQIHKKVQEMSSS